jgi:hypothetical protein
LQKKLETRGYCFHNHPATGLVSKVRCRQASSVASTADRDLEP